MEWDVTSFRTEVFRQLPFRFAAGQDVLDVGCGGAGDSAYLASVVGHVVGIDIEARREWRQLDADSLHIAAGDARSLPFADHTFDVAFAKDVLHHVLDVDSALREIKRVVKPGGSVVILEANRYNPLLYIHLTRLEGHEHFPRWTFEAHMRRHFQRVRFHHFEAHVYPHLPASLLTLIHSAERLLEALPGAKQYCAYNVAIATV